jgi:hypothetical protein
MTPKELAEFVMEELKKMQTDEERQKFINELYVCFHCGNLETRCTCAADE